MAKKRKPKTMPEYQDSYPRRFQKGTLRYVLDQEAGIEETTAARKQVLIAELPPSDFSNAMHKIGRPVGMEYRLAPEWEIWLAARRFENRRMKDELEAAGELIVMLERELDED